MSAPPYASLSELVAGEALFDVGQILFAQRFVCFFLAKRMGGWTNHKRTRAPPKQLYIYIYIYTSR